MISDLQRRTKKIKPIAVYDINISNGEGIVFSKYQLLTFYYISQFNYFTRDQLNQIYRAISKRKAIQSNWLSSCTGTRIFPISKYPKKNHKDKGLYYFNRAFYHWLIETTETLFPDESLTFRTDQVLQKELFEFFLNDTSGRPKTLNEHDLIIRQIVLDILCEYLSLENRPNIAITFPLNRKDTYVLPDAIVCLNGTNYYIEYDNYTENQTRLYNKVNTYSNFEQFRNAPLFFVFKDKRIKRGNDDYYISKRIENFSENIEGLRSSGESLFQKISAKNISLYSFPLVNAASFIRNTIDSIMVTEDDIKSSLATSNISNHSTITGANDNADFDFYITTQNAFYETETIPLIVLEYGRVGNNLLLDHLENQYRNNYHSLAIYYINPNYPNDNLVIDNDYFIELIQSRA
uniref:replication-relaxation family protein n=1 Tax=Streptococcus pluranimalium TaxID=82348 RepID=UPI003F68D37F